MRSFLLMASLVATMSVPVQAQNHAGFTIQTTFEYAPKGIKSEGTLILEENNKAWTTLLEPIQGLVLLGRLNLNGATSVKVEYIVVDSTQKNAVISTPQMVVRLGEPAEIAVGENKTKLKIKIQVDKTIYNTK